MAPTPRRRSAVGKLIARLLDPRDSTAGAVVAAACLAAEAVLMWQVVERVAYTEIDWVAYMQEVRGVAEGERDYMKLRGDTGPLVYPAGFVWLFEALRRVTRDGADIRTAQWIFSGVYLCTQAAVMTLYVRGRSIPPLALPLLCLSRRVKSLHALRLFNDCFVSLFSYLGLLFLQSQRWTPAILLLSLAVSVKMSALLLAPGVLAVAVKFASRRQLLVAAAAGVALQLALAWPFLSTFPRSYIIRSFDLGRVFEHRWSVSWQFVPDAIFRSPRFAYTLTAIHLRLLYSFASSRWLVLEGGPFRSLRLWWGRSLGVRQGRREALLAHERRERTSLEAAALKARGTRARRASAGAPEARPAPSTGGTAAPALSDEVLEALRSAPPPPGPPAGAEEDFTLVVVATSLLVGIFTARTIHYQFYAWYFHLLPYLLLRTLLPLWFSLTILAGVELAYNIYPPTPATSALLLTLHLITLAATWALPKSFPGGYKPKIVVDKRGRVGKL